MYFKIKCVTCLLLFIFPIGILTLLLVCNERGVALPEIEITRINSKMMEAATYV